MAKQRIKKAQSKDSLQFYTQNKKQATVFPNYSLQAVMQLLDQDPAAKGALMHFVDKCMEGDYAILDRESMTYDKALELTLDEKFKFRTEILAKIFLIGKMYQNVFIEIVKDSENNTRALNVLDTQNVEPITLPNGDPIGYTSKIANPITGEYPRWTKDEIVWLKFYDRSQGMAPIDLRALYETLMTKQYIIRYVAWLWQTGQYRAIWMFENSSKDDLLDFAAFNRKSDSNFMEPMLGRGKIETKILRDMKEQESIQLMLKYLDNQVCMIMRIPPIDLGMPDASGRSNSDAQSNNLVTHVTAFKKIAEDGINFQLFPKINKANSLLRFGPSDRFSETQVLENVQMMKSMGMTDEVIGEYLADRGMFFGAEKLFVDPIEQAGAMASATGQLDNPRSNDSAPSRQGKKTGQANQTQSAPTTRADQLKKQ